MTHWLRSYSKVPVNDLFPNLDTLHTELAADSGPAATDATALVQAVTRATTSAEARSALREVITSWLGERL